MRGRRNGNKFIFALAFACGAMACCFLPSRFLVAVLAIWVVILAISCHRY